MAYAPLPAPEQAPPVCYRHPDRVSYVRCTRCDRPICGECQIPASVGFQCPDDVRAGNKSMRARQGAFGGTVAAQARVTQVLIGLNVVMFVVTGGYLLGLGGGSYSDLFLRLAQRTADVLGPDGQVLSTGVEHGAYYRLLTAMFLHFGIVHIALNMFLLYSAGPVVERVLGHWRFALVYLGGGFAGSVAGYVLLPPETLAAGASGAVFATIGALMVITYRSKQDMSNLWRLVGVNAALNVLIAFTTGGIGWQAHLGGIVGGAVLTAILVYAPRAQRLVVQLVGCGAVLALLVGVVVLRTAALS